MSFVWPTINKGFLYVRLGSQSLRIVTRVSLFLASERASKRGKRVRDCYPSLCIYLWLAWYLPRPKSASSYLRKCWPSYSFQYSNDHFSRTEFFTCHRFLAFSPSPIESTFVEIDGSPLELPATQVEGPLFACQWDPDKYSSGIHSMTVKVQVHYHPRFYQSREKTLTHCLNTPLE